MVIYLQALVTIVERHASPYLTRGVSNVQIYQESLL